jgi:hypothetical protein
MQFALCLLLALSPSLRDAPSYPEFAPQDPPNRQNRLLYEALHERTREVMARMRNEMSEQRNRLLLQLAGKKVRGEIETRILSAQDIERWFFEPMKKVETAITSADSDVQAVRDRRLAVDDFYARCYDRAREAIAVRWRMHLREAGSGRDGYINMYLAEYDLVQAACDQRTNSLSVDEKYGAANPRRTAVERANEAEQRNYWEETGRRYGQLKDHLVKQRTLLAIEMWQLQNDAFRRIVTHGDSHEVAAGNLRRQFYNSFGDKEPGINSDLDYFINFPGSPDRLITSYGSRPWCTSIPFPDIQVMEGSPGVLKLNAIGRPSVDEMRPFQPYARVVWERPQGAPRFTYTASGSDTAVQPIRFGARGTLGLLLGVNGIPLQQLADSPVTVRIASIHQAAGQGRTIEVARPGKTLDYGWDGMAAIDLVTEKLLRDSGTKINQNLFEATVQLGGKGAVSTNRLHVMRQKLILFIPGVFGSEISVNRNSKIELAFPSLSLNLVGAQPFSWLECGANGAPLRGNEAAKLDLFRTYESMGKSLSTVYAVEQQQPVIEPEGHVRLLVNGNPFKHYLVQPWPYDWRLRLEGSVDRLMASGTRAASDPVRPPYVAPPSLQQIVAAAMREHPLMDSKAALACHSTGGLITRGALMRPGIEETVDRAFFINVPFWGAPKAYYVYLTGDMGIPLVANELMRTIAPNTPIVYYLAPTELYPDPVTVNGRNEVLRSPGQNVGIFMSQMVREARALGRYPNGIPPWNPTLEASARAFHASIQGEPRIGWQNCRVFWSNSRKHDTIGWVWVDQQLKAIKSWPTDGDGTVPEKSQKADFAAHPECLVEISTHPEHVPAPSDPVVWRRIVSELCELPAN